MIPDFHEIVLQIPHHARIIQAGLTLAAPWQGTKQITSLVGQQERLLVVPVLGSRSSKLDLCTQAACKLDQAIGVLYGLAAILDQDQEPGITVIQYQPVYSIHEGTLIEDRGFQVRGMEQQVIVCLPGKFNGCPANILP